ncbi:uncharacterized protein LOC128509662 [Clarias gariepinus]|uniref:uncharacterized protein LOC128509662 n=1 Tax=Clarias gariepinus TaxID=13013 RepID=UPI00234C7136|nr:uncharacterized protein LOC128509662 [Clarias gariepinus]
MTIYTSSLILFCQLVLTSSPSLSQRTPPYEMAKLGEPATLTCQGECSGSARWIMGRKGPCVADCNHTKCHHEKGFNISHYRYLKGDLSLTINTADYRKRTWFTCQCDGELIRRVYLRFQRMNYSFQLEHGESFSVNHSISERVKITFNRTADGGSQESLTLYETSESKVHYHTDYKERAVSKSCFILSDVTVSDSGVYAVWDADNDEVIATYRLTVTEKKTDGKTLPPVTGEQAHSSWAVGGMFCLGLVLGVLLHRYVLPWTSNKWNRLKKKITNGSERDQRPAEENDDSAEKDTLNPAASSQVSDG